MAPFVYATNEETKINVTHGDSFGNFSSPAGLLWFRRFQANAVFVPELGNWGFNWWIWCMYFQQLTYVLGVHLQYRIWGGFLPSLEAGLERKTRLRVKSVFPVGVMWRGQCALWPARERASGAQHTCLHAQGFKNSNSSFVVNALSSSFSLQTE